MATLLSIKDIIHFSLYLTTFFNKFKDFVMFSAVTRLLDIIFCVLVKMAKRKEPSSATKEDYQLTCKPGQFTLDIACFLDLNGCNVHRISGTIYSIFVLCWVNHLMFNVKSGC